MAPPLDDEQVQARIEELEEEERRLRRDESEAAEAEAEGREQVAADAARLEALRVELAQLWDYLRQRRALRAADLDPDGAEMRDPGTVERYLG